MKSTKDLEKKLKEGKKMKTLADEEMWELKDKLIELKESLGKRARCGLAGSPAPSARF